MYARPSVLELADLAPLDQTLLWAMRAWVIGFCRQTKVADRIETVFTQLGAPEATHQLEGFMSALSQGTRQVLEVNCVCQTVVSDDERALLDIFVLQQDEDHDEAFSLLSAMLSETATVAACACANRLVLALNAAGHAIPRSTAGRLRQIRMDLAPDATSPSLHILH